MAAEPAIFAGPGEMAARCRAFDWGATPLGAIGQWTRSLSTMADAVLASRNPMLLFWGPELIQFYNDAFRPSLGPSTGPNPRHPRALGMRAADFWADTWDVVGPQVDGVMMRGEAVWCEHLHLPRDDAWWTHSFSPVRDDDGRINGTLVVCLETTDTVRALRALESERTRATEILEAMTDAYFALDADFHIVAVNRAMERAVDLSRDQILGRTLWEAFPGTVGTEWERQFRRTVEARKELHFKGPYVDGRLDLIAESDTYPTPDGGFAVFWRDVTERERGAQERERLLAEAEAARRSAETASRAKSDFLAVMSHELRTPLNAIGGFAELIADGIHGPVTPAQRNALERIQTNQRHLLGLINGVLNYAKTDSGEISYVTVDFAIDETIVACSELVALQAQEKGLELQTKPCGTDVIAHADRDKVQQVLLNLLSNAVKFTDQGSISLTCERTAGGQIAVHVSDTGRGIAPDKLETIFHPFVQIDTKLTREQEGVGLGLSISRELARGMGGDLTAKSEVGRGTTFTFTVPAAQRA
jgi:PAS domain S-box-containing protein